MDFLISVYEKTGLWLLWINVALIILFVLSFGQWKPRLLKAFGKLAFIMFGCEIVLFGVSFVPLNFIFTSEGISWVQAIMVMAAGFFLYWLYLRIDDSLE